MPSTFKQFPGNSNPGRAGIKALTINALSGALEVGGTVQLAYSITWFGKGTRQLVPGSETWSLTVGDGTVATISSAGVITGVGAGNWTAKLVIEGISATYSNSVNAAAAAATTLVISPDPVSTLTTAGGTVVLAATVYDQYGNPMTGRTINWTTSDAGVATRTTPGSTSTITAVATGSTTITATDSVVGTATDSVSVSVNTALVPDHVTVTPNPLSLAEGSTRQLVARTYTSSNVEIIGRTYSYAEASAAFSVSGTGLVTAVAAGGPADITVTDITDASPRPSTTVATTVTTPAAGAGQAESPTGRRPQYVWTPEQQYVYNQWWADYQSNPTGTDPHIKLVAEMVKQASTTNWTIAADLYQFSGLQSWADIAISGYQTNLTASYQEGVAIGKAGVDADAIREYLFPNVHYYDVLYAGMNATQKTNCWQALDLWIASALGEITTGSSQSGGISDDDQNIGEYHGLVAAHFLNVAENTRYRNILNGTRKYSSSATQAIGGEAAALTTGVLDDYSTQRNAVYTWQHRGSAGGNNHEGTSYAVGTLAIMLHSVYGIRAAATNGNGRSATDVDLASYCPEMDAMFEEIAARNEYKYYPDYTGLGLIADCQDGGHLAPIKWYRAWKLSATIAGIAWRIGNANAQRCQRTAADFHAAKTSEINQYIWANSRCVWFYNPYATALVGARSWDAAPEMSYIGRTDAPSIQYWGPGEAFIKFGGTHAYHVSFYGNERLTDHVFNQGGMYDVWRDGQNVLKQIIGYNTSLTGDPKAVNMLSLAGLGPMNYNITSTPFADGFGVVRTGSGTAGGNAYCSYVWETHGPFYYNGYYNPPPSFVTEAERRFVWVHRVAADYDALVVQTRATTADLMGNQPIGTITLTRHTDNISVTNTNTVQYLNDHRFKTAPAGLVWNLGTSTVIPAGRWGTVLLSIAADNATTQATWAATYNYLTQAEAEAVMPAVPAGHTALGWVSIKAGSSFSWTAGTSALQGGGGTTPASISSYKSGWSANPYKYNRYSPADQSRILAEKALTGSGSGVYDGSEQVLHNVIPTAATFTAGPPAYHEWTLGGQTCRVYHLAPTASTTPAGTLTHNRVACASLTPAGGAETTGFDKLRTWNSTRQDTNKYVQVFIFGTGAAPSISLSSNNPDIVLVGSRTVTFGATSETVT